MPPSTPPAIPPSTPPATPPLTPPFTPPGTPTTGGEGGAVLRARTHRLGHLLDLLLEALALFRAHLRGGIGELADVGLEAGLLLRRAEVTGGGVDLLLQRPHLLLVRPFGRHLGCKLLN